MKLWTIQDQEVLNIINEKGYFQLDDYSKSNMYEDFTDAYKWMVTQMCKRLNMPNENTLLPIWAWYKYDWKNEVPELETFNFGVSGNTYVCIEFEIEDDEVLLSDFDSWHVVLNDIWFDGSLSEEEWNTLYEWYYRLPTDEQEILKVASWDRIFDIKPFENDWCSVGKYVQACFFKLTKEMITNTTIYTQK